MFFNQETVKLRPLVIHEQADADALQEIGFMTNSGENHAPMLAQGRGEV